MRSIEFAIAAATERGLAVRLVHVWDLPAIYSWDAMNVAGVSAEWTENAERHLENVAAEWRQKYPELTIADRCPPRSCGRRHRHGGHRMPMRSSWSSAPATTPG